MNKLMNKSLTIHEQFAGLNISQNSWINHPGKVSLFGLVREEFHISIIHAFCRELHFEQKTCLKQKLSALFKCFLT